MDFTKWFSDLFGGDSETPSMDWKKKEIKAWMTENKLSYNSGDTKQDLLDKIKWNQ